MDENAMAYSVLLAEDRPVSQRVVINDLEGENCTLSIVNNGREALEKVQETRFDVILMNIAMPVMDGFTATAKIREWERENGRAQTPILGMIVSVFRDDYERCIARQVDDVIRKPIKKQKFLEMVHRYVGRRSDAAAVNPSPETQDGGS